MKKLIVLFLAVFLVGCGGDAYIDNVNYIKKEISQLDIDSAAQAYYDEELKKLYDNKKDDDLEKFKEATKQVYFQAYNYGANYKKILDKIWIYKYKAADIYGVNEGQDGFLLSTIDKKSSDAYLAQGKGRYYNSFENGNMTWTLGYNGNLTINYSNKNGVYINATSYELVDNKYLVLTLNKFNNKKVKDTMQLRLADADEFNQSEEEGYIQ